MLQEVAALKENNRSQAKRLEELERVHAELEESRGERSRLQRTVLQVHCKPNFVDGIVDETSSYG